jgi:hypothetical protein
VPLEKNSKQRGNMCVDLYDKILQINKTINTERVSWQRKLIPVGLTIYTYVGRKYECVLCGMCVKMGIMAFVGCRELQGRSSKIESCSGISQIARSYNDVYPINPKN